MCRAIRNVIVIAIAVVMACSIPTPASAGVGLAPGTLDRMVGRSSLVAIGQITKFVEDFDASNDVSKSGAIAGRINGQGLLAPQEVVKLRGTYTLDITGKIKGECESSIELHTRSIPTFGFDDAPLEIKVGGKYLLFLSLTGDGQWTSLDPLRPFIPIASAPVIDKLPEDPAQFVMRLLIASLSDPKLRGTSLMMLSATRDPEIIAAVTPFRDDPDLRIQDGVLCCLATNKVIDAIPRIAELQPKLTQAHIETQAVQQLISYDRPEAVPSLNQLLFNTSSSLARTFAVHALRENKIANKSSIPFLIVGLSDPNPDMACQSYYLLHELIPDLGPAKDSRTFLSQPHDLDIQQAQKWWSDELAGKHTNSPPLILPRSITSTPTPLPAAVVSSKSSAGRGPAD